MELRSELQPPLVSPQHLAELADAIDRIERLLAEDGRDADAATEIAAFNEWAGHAYDAYTFRHYWRSSDREELAKAAARPTPPRVPDITRDELAEIVRRVMVADPDTDYYERLLETNVAHPAVNDLIFWPPEELRNATPEEVVDVALRNRPIEAEPGNADPVRCGEVPPR